MSVRGLGAGPAFVATLIVAAMVGRPFGHLPSPDDVERQLARHRMRVLVGTWLESVAAGLLILFAVGLAARFRRLETGAPLTETRPLGSLALAGGTATAGALLARAAVVAAAAERATNDGASRDTAILAVDVGNLLIGKMAPVGLALMTGATTLACQHGAPLPRWLHWGTAGLTVGLLSPLNFLFVLPGILWVGLVGFFPMVPTRTVPEPASDRPG